MMKELKGHGIRFEAIESYENVGGLWNIHNDNSPAYLSLTTNSSKGTTYLDQKAPASWPSYFSHEQALEYLNDFARRHQLLPNIHFSSRVDQVEKLDSDRWKVYFTDLTSGQRDSIVGHSVIVCTGIHSKQSQHIPRGIAKILDKSDIEFMHSSQYRDNLPYAGKRVLIVGFGNSAADIATEISEVTKRTLISTRSVPWIIPLWVLGVPADQFRGSAGALNIPFVIQNWIFHRLQRWYIGHPRRLGLGEIHHDLLDRLPVVDRGIMNAIRQGRIKLYGPIDRIESDLVFFSGESSGSEEVDHIILATGYERTYPFLSADLIEPVVQENRAFPMLIFHPEESNLFFASEVNLPQGGWPLFAKQAKAVASYLDAERQPGQNFVNFNKNRKLDRSTFKGRIFQCEDRFHVDPDVYGSHLDNFCRWVKN